MTNTFWTRYFDGQKTQAFEALVTILPEGLKICYEENNLRKETYWPKATLQIMERLHAPKPGVLGCKNMLGARLVVENAENYALILPLVPPRHIKLSHIHYPWRITWFLIALVLLILLLPIWRFHFVSIWLADVLPYSWEQTLWDKLAKPAFEGKTECVAPKGRKALDKLVTKLAAQTKSKHTFDVRVLDAPDIINAESLPGFNIFIYSGILKMETADALAGVLAHEMAHSLKHHVTAIFIHRFGLHMFMNTVFGLSNKSIPFDFINLKYIRDYEAQADQMGIDLLRKAKIDPAGFEQAMQFIKINTTNDFEGIEAYLVDHPNVSERIEMIRANKDLPDAEPSLTKKEWRDLQAICSETKPVEY